MMRGFKRLKKLQKKVRIIKFMIWLLKKIKGKINYQEDRLKKNLI